MLQVPGRSGVWEPLPDCVVARVRKFHPPRNDPKPRTGAEPENEFDRIQD